MSRSTLTFLRKATKAQDGSDGLLYRHCWGTGFQELVFRDEGHATRWLTSTRDSEATSEQASASYHAD